MQNTKNKTLAISIVLILTVSAASAIMLIPTTNAHTPPWQIQLFAFINVGPNPLGLGQTATVGFWLNSPPMTAGGPYGDRYGPFTINVIKPDGTNSTLGPFISDDTGGTSTRYTPDKIGTYKFQMIFPGENLTGATNNPFGAGIISNPNYVNDTLLPAVSNVATLDVQQEPIPNVPTAPLPTSYWQTPVSAMNVNNWYAISGPYLDLYMSYGPGKGGGNYNTTSNFNPYTTAPLSSHIIWTRPVAFGGTIGGDAGGSTTYGNYYSTSQYERKYVPIVINGYLYYTQFPGSSTNPQANICIDLYTGQTVWVNDGSNYNGGDPAHNMMTNAGLVTPLIAGQVLDYVSPNQYGGIAYLWTSGTPAWITPNIMNVTGTTLNLFDAMTGKYVLSIVNGTGFSYGLTVDASGDLVSYYTNATVGTQTIYGQIQPVTGPKAQLVTNTAGNSLLEVWNSTQAIMMGAGWSGASASGWMWRPPQAALINFAYGIQAAWQLPGTIPATFGNPGAANPTLPQPWTMKGVNSGVAILYSAANFGLTNYFQTGYTIFTGYDINTGAQLFVQNVSFVPYTAVDLDNYGNVGDGVFLTVVKETGQVTAFSVTTGQQVWTRTLTGENGAAIDPYDTVGGIKGNIYGNSFLLFGFGGDLWSLNMQTGAVNWSTNTTTLMGDAGQNTPYAIWPVWVQTGIGGGGGLEFLEVGHEYAPPLFLGAQLLALNATTGKLQWSIDSFDVDANPELAYGIMTTLNAYDNQVYAYGQGPSKTTVTAPSVGVAVSTPITISGSVTDVSAGSKQEAVAANFPNGLPAVSDDSMTQWMEYVYMQQTAPTNTTGVPVTITAVDPNHNIVTLGSTTSDASGTYALTWTPPDVPGNYEITATFGGTNGYYPSSAETHLYVAPAHATPAPTAAPQTDIATMTGLTYGIAAAVIAIIIAIAIVGLLLLRKKP